MQFFNSQQPWANSKFPQMAATRARNGTGLRKPESYGWYDSSLDLAQGLEVVEQDNDTVYQLWELSRR